MAEVCVTINTTGWTREQTHFIVPIAYYLLWRAGDDIVPNVNTVAGGHRICVDDPTCDVVAVLTAEIMLTKYAEWSHSWEKARLQAERERAEAEEELDVNEIHRVALTDVSDKIGTLTNLTDTTAFLGTLTRYIVASRTLHGRLS